MNLDINKKIEGIIQSNTLDDLSLKFLPPVSSTPDNYYFISYSHKDYKSVYPDIYALQAEGVNVWYDRAMPAGENWKETAEKYIRPSRCAGVVFYVSENSLLSPAIHEEIAFAKRCGKSCLTINLPMSDGKSRSAKEMLDALIANGAEVADDKYAFITNSFNNEVLYIPYTKSADQKAEKIYGLKRRPVLNFYGNALISTNDIEITRLKQSDFDCNEYNPIGLSTRSETGESKPILIDLQHIRNCALANCQRLESVELPNTVMTIESYAFYGCQSLKSIDLSRVKKIGDYAFTACTNLQCVNFGKDSPLESIPAHAFEQCKSLTDIIIPDSVTQIRENAFCYCGLQRVVIPNDVKSIAEFAFAHCEQMTEVVFGNGLVELDLSCIARCWQLKKIFIGKNTKLITNWLEFARLGHMAEISIHQENEYYRVEDGTRVINKTTNQVEFDCNDSGKLYRDIIAKVSASADKE